MKKDIYRYTQKIINQVNIGRQMMPVGEEYEEGDVFIVPVAEAMQHLETKPEMKEAWEKLYNEYKVYTNGESKMETLLKYLTVLSLLNNVTPESFVEGGIRSLNDYIKAVMRHIDIFGNLRDRQFFKDIDLSNLTEEQDGCILDEEPMMQYMVDFISCAEYDEESGYVVPRIAVNTVEQDVACLLDTTNNIDFVQYTYPYFRVIDRVLPKLTGKVLIYGCDLGYLAYMLSEREDVESITIIDFSQKVIDIFKEKILPQIKNKDKIKVIGGYTLLHLSQLKDGIFDTVYVEMLMGKDIFYDSICLYAKSLAQRFKKTKVYIQNEIEDMLVNSVLHYYLTYARYVENKPLYPDTEVYDLQKQLIYLMPFEDFDMIDLHKIDTLEKFYASLWSNEKRVEGFIKKWVNPYVHQHILQLIGVVKENLKSKGVQGADLKEAVYKHAQTLFELLQTDGDKWEIMWFALEPKAEETLLCMHMGEVAEKSFEAVPIVYTLLLNGYVYSLETDLKGVKLDSYIKGMRVINKEAIYLVYDYTEGNKGIVERITNIMQESIKDNTAKGQF